MTVNIQESPIEAMVGQAIDKIAPETPLEDGQAEVEETTEEVTETQEQETEATDEFLAKARPQDIKDPVALKLYDELVKDYTKKMMDLGAVKTDAEAFQRLKQNPVFLDFVKAQVEKEKAEKEKATEEEQPKIIDLSAMTEEERAQFYRNKFKDEIKREVMAEVTKEIAPVKETLDKNNREAVDSQLKVISDTFFEKNPEADKFRTEIATVLRRITDLPADKALAEAWNYVQYKNAPGKAINQARQELEVKKEANLLTVTDKTSPTKRTDKIYSSTEEATRDSMAELGL
jgi:hypothetical protein